MKSLKDAQRAMDLASERSSLIGDGNGILRSETPLFASGRPIHWHVMDPHKPRPTAFDASEVADEFRALLTKALKMAVAKIDDELRALGFEPDPNEPVIEDEEEAAAA